MPTIVMSVSLGNMRACVKPPVPFRLPFVVGHVAGVGWGSLL